MFYGIDGCKAGWVVARSEPGSPITFSIYASIQDFWTADGESITRVLIDIPIGLSTFPQHREADFEARKALKLRRSSVFSVPYRDVLEFGRRHGLGFHDYPAANAFSKRDLAKGISKQAWAILPKISEIDSFLAANAKADGIFREIHPEILFWALNNCREMRYNKATSFGFLERVELLSKFEDNAAETLKSAYEQYRRHLQPDDLVDAMVACIAARQGVKRSFPAYACKDDTGRHMRIWY